MPLIDSTAKQLAFEKYYHYQPFFDKHKGYLRDILKNRTLHFSNPHSVNDPWDCKPWFDYRPMLKDADQREAMIVALRSLVTPKMLAHPFRAIYDDRLRTNDDMLIKDIEIFSTNMAEQIGQRGIYCLTPFPKSTLMWSHYANDHKGICLEFDKHNPLIEKARPVNYCRAYPEWTLKALLNNPLPIVLTKSMDWCYEREFRLIASPFVDGPLQMDGSFVALPDGALTAIIVGCENTDFDEIKAMVDEHAPGLAIKRASLVPFQFELTISD